MRLLFLFILSTALLPANAAPPIATATRGPYIQCATPTGIKIVWRTRSEGTPGVRFGSSPTTLDSILPPKKIITLRPVKDLPELPLGRTLAAAPENTRQYEADISGLRPDTVYYYTVTLDGVPLNPPGPDYSFRTLPIPGTARDGLFWVVGDSGTGNKVQAKVHTAMRDWLKKQNRVLDGYLHVGDMAYGSGLDSEFQGFFFETYADTLRNTVCWPSMGNHEGRHSSGLSALGPYYDGYVTPTEGQSGGRASGTEAYYSFDFGKAHFICLNSHDLRRDPAGAMAEWLKADLEQTKADFVTAFFHHPPYTKGSHDSDKEFQLIEMRSMIMPILESGGVDLVLSGHSHIYERSMLMDGAYATPTVAENVILNDGDGNSAGDGSYQKSKGLHPNEGTVQVVTGHGGTTLSRKRNPCPVMRVSIMEFGSVLLDLKGNTMNLSMLNADGVIRDTFQIVKQGKVTVQRIANPWKPAPFSGPKSVPTSVATSAPDRSKDDGESPFALSALAVPLIPPSSEWQYLAGTKPADGWREAGFDATGWLTGKAGFGYSDKDDATEIKDMRDKYRYLCLRREIKMTGNEIPKQLRLNVSYDDGFIAYLNGKEVLRVNAESDSLDKIKGVSPHEANGKFELFRLKIPPGLIQPGTNVISIEGYNDDLNSSDFTLHPALYLEVEKQSGSDTGDQPGKDSKKPAGSK